MSASVVRAMQIVGLQNAFVGQDEITGNLATSFSGRNGTTHNPEPCRC